MSDLRYALRVLRARPGLSIAIILMLALGIGANTAIFSLVDAVLLKALPVREPDRLMLVQRLDPSDGDTDDSLSYPLYRDLQAHGEGIERMAAYSPLPLTLTEPARGGAERVQGELVSGTYFETLGVRAALGRLIAPGDDLTRGAHPVVVFTHRFWTRRFGADPSVLGRTIRLNAQSYTVIGVTPPEFFGLHVGSSPDVRLPMMMEPLTSPPPAASALISLAASPSAPAPPDNLSNRRRSWLHIVARLQPGVDPRRAEASLSAVMRRAYEAEAAELMRRDPGFAKYRDEFLAERVHLEPGRRGVSSLRQRFSMPLRVLMAMVGAVLLIACANVASLLLTRAMERRREMAIRAAIGASRARLVRLMAAETMLLVAIAAVLGLFIALWARDALVAVLSVRTPLQLDVTLDRRLLLFAVLVSIATGLLAGVLPSLRALRGPVSPALKQGGLGTLVDRASRGSVGSGGRGARRRPLLAHRVLATAQIAITLVLLVGAGLLVRTLLNLRHLDAGLRPDRVLLADIDPGARGYAGARLAGLYEAVQAEIARVPGVRRVSFAGVAVLGGRGQRNTISVPGYVPGPDEDMNVAGNAVSPGYFTTMGMTLLRGRDFTDRDAPALVEAQAHAVAGAKARASDRTQVAIVNETMARRFFGGRDPVGAQFFFGDQVTGTRVEIVGVVRDARYRTLRERVPPMAFTPIAWEWPSDLTLHVQMASDASGRPSAAQQSTATGPAASVSPLHASALHVSAVHVSAVTGAIARALRAIDPELPIDNVRTFEQQIDGALSQERLLAALAASFALLALGLAVVGLFGVLSYGVARRTRELGVRLALGADPARLRWLVLRDDLRILTIGLAIGLTVAFYTTRVLDSLVYGVVVRDRATLAIAAATVVASALAAAIVPARRATRVDPMTALRAD